MWSSNQVSQSEKSTVWSLLHLESDLIVMKYDWFFWSCLSTIARPDHTFPVKVLQVVYNTQMNERSDIYSSIYLHLTSLTLNHHSITHKHRLKKIWSTSFLRCLTVLFNYNRVTSCTISQKPFKFPCQSFSTLSATVCRFIFLL